MHLTDSMALASFQNRRRIGRTSSCASQSPHCFPNEVTRPRVSPRVRSRRRGKITERQVLERDMNSNLKTLSEKIQTLSAEQITEVEDFVEFLRYRGQDRELARSAA